MLTHIGIHRYVHTHCSLYFERDYPFRVLGEGGERKGEREKIGRAVR